MTPPDAPTPPASVETMLRERCGCSGCARKLYPGSFGHDGSCWADRALAAIRAEVEAKSEMWRTMYNNLREAVEANAASARAAGYAAGGRCTQEELRPYTRHLPFCERYFAKPGTDENAACSCGLDRALAPRPDGAEKLRFHSGEQVMEHFVPGYKRPDPPESPYKADGAEKEEKDAAR